MTPWALILWKAVLPKNYATKIVLKGVVVVATLSDSEQELIRVYGRANEEAAGLKSVSNVLEEGFKLLLFLKLVMNGHLTTGDIKYYLLSYVFKSGVSLEGVIQEIIGVAGIAVEKDSLEQLVAVVLRSRLLRLLFGNKIIHVSPPSLCYLTARQIRAYVMRDTIAVPFGKIAAGSAAKIQNRQILATMSRKLSD